MSNTINNEVTLIRKGYNEETWSEYAKCSYAFFPGCQLSGCEPEIVIKAYDSIRFQKPDTGIFIHCCGMHADMNSENEAFEANAEAIRNHWKYLGKPTLIIACPGCYKVFKEKLPDIKIISFYELLLDMNISGGCNSENYIILDPASSAGQDKIQTAVRQLAEDMGVKLHEASEESEDLPYLTYSIAHRNELKKQGKEAVHILEMIYGMGASNVPLPTEEEMRENKHQLKQAMLEFFWSEV